jgi:hypothetical protein
MSNILPNAFGRPSFVREPPGVEHIYPDPQDRSLPVMLAVWKKVGIPPQKRHWAIVWQVGTASTGDSVHRMLAIVRERGPTGLLDYLTNWGPKTRIAGPDLQNTGETVIYYPLETLTYAQRQALEKIGAAEVVHEPDGKWSCQTWVESVLDKGMEDGLFLEQNVVKAAIDEAMKH